MLRLDEARLALLDAPRRGAGLARPGPDRAARRMVARATGGPGAPPPPPGPLAPALRARRWRVAAALEAAEPRLTDLDGRAGDGDLGLSMQRGAAALRALPAAAWADPPTALAAMAEALRRAIGGSSGPFYATALLRAARALPAAPGPADWAAAFAAGGGGDRRAGRREARRPHHAGRAGAGGRGLRGAAADEGGRPPRRRRAEAGVAATAAMLPRLGRASYLGDRARRRAGCRRGRGGDLAAGAGGLMAV